MVLVASVLYTPRSAFLDNDDERRPLLSADVRRRYPKSRQHSWYHVVGVILMIFAGSLAVWTTVGQSWLASSSSSSTSPSTLQRAKRPPQAVVSSKHEAVRPVETTKHHGASSTVRSRSVFTCALCVVAALVILLPRLACGPDDAHGGAAGPGEAEAVVSRELQHGAALAIPWLALAVPLDSIDRSVVRGEFPYPLTVVALELSASALLGVACSKRSTPLKEEDDRLSDDASKYARWALMVLGACLAGAMAASAEADRSCGPRLVAAFGSGQALIVLVLVCVQRQRDATAGAAADADATSASQHTQDDSPLEDDCEECCCCCLGAHGVPGCASLLALVIAFGGAAVMGLGEAEVGPIALGCASTACAGQVLAAFYLVGLDSLFRKTEYGAKESLFPILATSTSAGGCLAALAAALFEVILPRFSSSFAPRRLAPPKTAYWLLVTDVCGSALLNALSVAVVRRFSPIVYVLFLTARSAISLFVQAALFGDVLTSLEYKGAMILVLGLAIWGLEVSKATLEKPPVPTVHGAEPLAPSNFLERPFRQQADMNDHIEDSDDDDDGLTHASSGRPLDELTIVRLGRSGLSIPPGRPHIPNAADSGVARSSSTTRCSPQQCVHPSQ